MIACAAFTCAAQQAPEIARLLEQAAALNQRGDFAQAVLILKQAANLAPRDPSVSYLLGQTLLESGHTAEAVGWLRQAVAANPGNEPARGFLGDAEMKLREFS